MKKFKSSRLEMFFKVIFSFENFSIITEKLLCWGAGLKICKLFKNSLQHRYSRNIAKFLRTVFLYNNSSGCSWQSYHSAVRPAGVSVLWFCASTSFQFWSKTFTNSSSNNSLLTRDKSISFLLDLIGHMLLISKQVLEKH